jgi:nucleoside-diphosphate-sugar epimerase
MALAGKRILVTGGSGFLGGALVRRLATEGAHVRALARSPEKATYIQNLDNVEILKGDITDAGRMAEVLDGCEIVFHVAASTGGPLLEQWRMNVDGTRNVARAAAASNVSRFVYVSTISVYGYRQRSDVTEETPPDPGHDPYNITKNEAENELRFVAGKTGLTYSIIRPGQIYGPRSGMWTKTLFRLASVQPTPFVGDGSGSVFPIYVDDVVDLMLLMADRAEAANQAFNCTPDPSPTWRAFLGAYARFAGNDTWLSIPSALVTPVAALVGALARPQTQAKELPNLLGLAQSHITYKNTKARDLLGWTPKTDLETGVQNCVPYLREQGLLS